MSTIKPTVKPAARNAPLVGRRPLTSQKRDPYPTAGGELVGTEEKQPTPLLSIVIPTYNEQDNISRVYERLVQALDGLKLDWELIFSVDPCTDRTEDLILEL